VKLEGDDWDWGWNVGLLYQITDTIKFGASYRSEIEHSITSGNVKFSPQGVNGFTDVNDASAPLTLPAIAYLGLSWAPKPFTFEFDMQWTDWGSYNQLEVDFNQTIGIPGATATSGISKEKDWNSVWAYRFGAQYSATDWLDLRVGYIYDPSPIPSRTLDPLVPSGDRKLYCLGFGIHNENMTLDFAYNYLQDESRDFNNSVGDAPVIPNPALAMPRTTGRFKDVDAHIVAINLSYKF
jgi:long-chain fatty acid transport protein